MNGSQYVGLFTLHPADMAASPTEFCGIQSPWNFSL